MLTMLRPASGYIYYVAVAPSQRRAGLGGLLLEDALGALRDAGAKETFACIRAENLASLRLFRARGFARITLRDLIRMRGFVRALCLWLRMVVAPGEEVFRKVMDGP